MFEEAFLVITVLCVAASVLAYIIYRILRNPFCYPYFTHSFDVSGKRNPSFEDCIDNYLRNEQNWNAVVAHEQKIQEWKEQSEDYIQTCRLSNHRRQQYLSVLDDENAYRFKLIRKQTRYRQHNYVKRPYRVSVVDAEREVNWQWLMNRHEKLAKIGFETTLKDYNSKSQRKLMTASLRKAIMERDHYTCQNCGKYMPDEVGLQIDHIVPIAKGGKSIPSNLRVLCSRCNGSKGSKLM